ncbi:MAG TPA: GH25 family lysozyme, partial [Lachnospiraceae bacterium]|nr:GH25 family lysozyme [Lachnospiraceae bacterium]
GVGTAKITVSYKDALGNTKSASCTVTVVANPEQDTSSKLKDKDDNQIYVKNSNGEYVEATYADYYNASAFYLKTDVQYRYTGWQTINGNVYFFDKNGNKVTGEQVIQGVKYNFTSEGILAMNNNGVIGIDVSKWNGSIDWNAVKNSGISYVIIRCGYRGSSTGVLVEDPKFKTNIQGATAAGLKVGVYFFTQAVNEVEAVEEASMVLSLVKGYGVSYPIFIDTERANGRADGLDRNTRTAVCRAFCETIRNAGYSAGVYASKSWFNDNLNYSSLSGYKIWLAQYASAPTFANRYDMWQNSDKGSVSGISGKVDMNISYLGY